MPVPTAPDLVYYLLHKPTGVVTTAHDPEGRPTVVEPRARPSPGCSRSGASTTTPRGCSILTNDGELAQLLTHPSHGVDKTYLAEVAGHPTPRRAPPPPRGRRRSTTGRTAPARARVVGTHGDAAAVELTIHEGRNRQVRRMLDDGRAPGRRLVRTRVGPVHDDRLAPGEWRPLTRRRGPRALRGGERRRRSERWRRAARAGNLPRVRLQALRGATTCEANTKAEIAEKTQQLVRELLDAQRRWPTTTS